LQVTGKVVNENDYVRLGAFHTLDLEGESHGILFTPGPGTAVASFARCGSEPFALGYALPADEDQSLMTSANRDFRLSKTSGWDSVALERIEEATKEGRGAEVGAIVLGEGEWDYPLQTAPLPRGSLHWAPVLRSAPY
jgi:protein pelota